MGSEQKLDSGVLGQTANPEARFVGDHDVLSRYVSALRTLGQKVVLTSGTFDLLHVGHARYLEKAKEYGNILVVGVDSDKKVRLRKGPTRPIVPEEERVKMLAHLRSVDLITIKSSDEPKWQLIKSLSPDTLVVTAETYIESTIKELGQLCGRVVVLEPQATTSTSAKIRKMQVSWADSVTSPINDALDKHDASPELKDELSDVLNRARGQGGKK